LERDLLRGQSEVRQLLAEVGSGTSSNAAATRLAELKPCAEGELLSSRRFSRLPRSDAPQR
jgi:hypothetical protein